MIKTMNEIQMRGFPGTWKGSAIFLTRNPDSSFCQSCVRTLISIHVDMLPPALLMSISVCSASACPFALLTLVFPFALLTFVRPLALLTFAGSVMVLLLLEESLLSPIIKRADQVIAQR